MSKIIPIINVLDMKMPELKAGEILCDNCWAVSKSKAGWLTFNFKHLKQTNLCPKCAPKESSRLAELQAHGL